MDQEFNLKLLKERYSSLKKKYSLPEFDDLNRDFKIEKLADFESDFLLREIRSQIGESIENFIRMLEALLNPVNVPMFLFPIIKSINADDKEKLIKIHKELGKLVISSIKLMNYSEEKEAEFIKEAFKKWNNFKSDFVKIIEDVEKKAELKSSKKKNNYFG